MRVIAQAAAERWLSLVCRERCLVFLKHQNKQWMMFFSKWWRRNRPQKCAFGKLQRWVNMTKREKQTDYCDAISMHLMHTRCRNMIVVYSNRTNFHSCAFVAYWSVVSLHICVAFAISLDFEAYFLQIELCCRQSRSKFKQNNQCSDLNCC